MKKRILENICKMENVHKESSKKNNYLAQSAKSDSRLHLHGFFKIEIICLSR
jgi:hypothetical protein